jgi:hypothetical protein
MLSEAVELVEKTAKEVASLGALTVVEHGSVPDQPHGACITHAHWHLLPGIADLRGQLEEVEIGSEVNTLSALATVVDGHTPYYLLASGGRVTVHPIATRHESQLIRRMVADVLGLAPGYHDWSLFQDRDKFAATLELFGRE